MSKLEARKRLLNEYLDEYDRVKTSLGIGQNSFEGKYENNNMLLFTGEALLLLKKNNLLNLEARNRLLQGIFKCEHESYPGLFSRHPMPYRVTNQLDVVSHDEYNGIMYALVSVDDDLCVLADDIIKYYNDYGTFCDEYPGLSFTKLLIKQPIKTLKNIFKLIKCIKNKEDYRGKIGPLEIITYKRQPRDMAFYKLVSENYAPTLFEVCYMCLSTLLTLKKPLKYVRGSGRLMAIYRMWAIEELNLTNKVQSVIINLTNKLFRRGLKKQYGENYIEELHSMYFNLTTEHPFHELCKGLK